MKNAKIRAHTFAMLTVATCGVIALVQYGCSDDPVTPTAVKTDGGNSTTDSPSGGGDTGPAADTSTPGTSFKARATIQPTGLGDAGTPTGTVDFVETNGSVTVTVAITGAKAGDHGMHIHANASCEATDAGPAMAAGGHWNPADAGHGLPTSGVHHPGDFGNITIAADGTGSLNLTTTSFGVQATSPTSALQHAVIFHAGKDDGTTQPTGNSGGRAGCGIVQPQ